MDPARGALGDLNGRSSTGAQRALRELTKLPNWTRLRNNALRKAGYRCGECGARRNALVIPANAGPTQCTVGVDLVVRCDRCCGMACDNKAPKFTRNLYCKIVREIISGREQLTVADLSEEVKDRCLELGIRIDPHSLNEGINLVMAEWPAPPIRKTNEGLPPPPAQITRLEAKSLLARLFPIVSIKTIPLPFRSAPAVGKIVTRTPRENVHDA
jgi:hypothetical protein